ncbi:unnamed protein product [Psylliodes chrysocephalus]|uniref:Uncharacterized protein n=1 Tax=Psylliodes chrysocephalus TaxID=3402493 RepID=A0A9P0DGD3_9CUCU|nr:unnamed protein product [Psylliodes chrysocephala]
MVQNLLKIQPGALGTVEYLNLMNKIKVAFLDKNVSIYNRIYCMCVLEIIKRTNKIEYINDCITKLSDTFIFPRENNYKHNLDPNLNEFLNETAIEKCVNDALNAVKMSCQNLNMPVYKDSWKNIEYIKCYEEGKENVHSDSDSDDDLNINENLKQSDNIIEGQELFQNITSESEADREQEIIEVQAEMSAETTSEGGNILKNFTSLNINDTKTKKNVVHIKIGNKYKTIRKTTLCWLLEEQSNKLSSDRIIRVRGVPEFAASKNCKKSTVNLIETDKYYAIYYDDSWYIGKIIETRNDDLYRIKILKEDLGHYYWPNKDDIQTVKKEFILFGPITLLGFKPFSISRETKEEIKKIYKEYKRATV